MIFFINTSISEEYIIVKIKSMKRNLDSSLSRFKLNVTNFCFDLGY
jgi:hypothetical protein